MNPNSANGFEAASLGESPISGPIVFLIDDEEDLLFIVRTRLTRSNLDVREFLTAAEFRAAFAKFRANQTEMHEVSRTADCAKQAFIITDFRLGDATGVEILSAVADEPSVVGAVLQTGYFLAKEALPKLPFPVRVLEKPSDIDKIAEFIKECSANARLTRGDQ